MTELNGSPRRVEELTLDGVEVYVRVLTVGEMRHIESLAEDAESGNLDKMVAFFMAGACRQDGTRLYPDGNDEAVTALPWTAVQRAAEAVIDINGLSGDEEPAGN